MRVMKKILAMFAVLCMAIAMCVPAFAAEGEPGKITIDNAVNGKIYTIYRVFDLETDNAESPNAYKYTLNTKWAGLKDYSATIDEETVKASDFFTIDSTDSHVIWSKDKMEDADAAVFAKLLNAYQKANSIANDGTATASGSSVTFEDLPLGYYFVQTDLGSLCSLDTTNPTAAIKEKNSEPTIDKEVQEDTSYGNTNDAGIGDTVNFKTTINVVDGKPTNYVLHDKMSEGLTFDAKNGTTSVTVNGTAINTTASETERYYELVTGEDVSETTDKCTFEIKFYNLKANDVIEVSYAATLNDKAVIAGDGNSNEAWLKYGDNKTTTHDTTTTYTWEMPIFKYTGTNTPLAGAKFRLYTDKACTQEVSLIYDDTLSAYRPAKSDETAAVMTSPANGKISIKGLDAGTYYLKETEAPAGYNKLGDPITVVISSEESMTTGTTTRTKSMTQDGKSANQIGVKNETGPELPDTGGIGTTIFYVIGGILAAGALILLIAKRRMKGYED